MKNNNAEGAHRFKPQILIYFCNHNDIRDYSTISSDSWQIATDVNRQRIKYMEAMKTVDVRW